MYVKNVLHNKWVNLLCYILYCLAHMLMQLILNSQLQQRQFTQNWYIKIRKKCYHSLIYWNTCSRIFSPKITLKQKKRKTEAGRQSRESRSMILTDSSQCGEEQRRRAEKQEEERSQRDAELTEVVLKAFQLIDRMRACVVIQCRASCDWKRNRLRAEQQECVSTPVFVKLSIWVSIWTQVHYVLSHHIKRKK